MTTNEELATRLAAAEERIARLERQGCDAARDRAVILEWLSDLGRGLDALCAGILTKRDGARRERALRTARRNLEPGGMEGDS
jgi:hypothetical protein